MQFEIKLKKSFFPHRWIPTSNRINPTVLSVHRYRWFEPINLYLITVDRRGPTKPRILLQFNVILALKHLSNLFE